MKMLKKCLLGLGLIGLSASTAHAALVGRIDVGNPLLLVEVASTVIRTVSGSSADEITIQVTNNSTSSYVCRGKIGFYALTTGSNSAFPISAEKTISPGGPWVLVSTVNQSGSGLGNTLAYDSATCELAPDPDDDGSGGTGAAGGGGGVAGEAYLSGTMGYTADPQANTITLTASRVTNPSSNGTTGSLELQLVAANTAYTGGSLSGYTLGYSRLPAACGPSGTLAPGVSCTNISLPTSYTAPPAGTYTAVLILTQHNSTQCASNRHQCIIDWFNFTKPLVIEANGNTNSLPDAGGIEIVGGGIYRLNWSADQVHLELDQVRNASRTRATDALRLELWLTAQPYVSGNISGYKVLAERLPGTCAQNLTPGSSCLNLSIDRAMLTRPPAGTYFVTVLVTEYNAQNCTAQDRYCIATSRAGTGTNDVPAVQTTPPPPPPTTSPPASSGGGGGGSMGWELLIFLSLGLLPRLRRLKK